jgi:hypothetical protein
VEIGKPVVLKEEVVVEDFPHQAVIIADGGPVRRLHRVQEGADDSRGEVGLHIGVSLACSINRVRAASRVGQEPPLVLLVPRLLGGAWSGAECVLVDLRVQIWVVQLAQERRHVGKVGKLVSVPGLWLQSKLNEDIPVVDVA